MPVGTIYQSPGQMEVDLTSLGLSTGTCMAINVI